MRYYDICYRPMVFLLAAGSAICGVTVMSEPSRWDSFSEVSRRLSAVPAQLDFSYGSANDAETTDDPDTVGLEQQAYLDFSGAAEVQLTQNEVAETAPSRN